MAAIVLLSIAWGATASAKNTHQEYWYQAKYCAGVIEHVLPDRARVDCLTKYHAIEYDFGYKWAECAGQAQLYARSTSKIAGCVIIKPSPAELQRLIKAFDGAIWLADDNKIVRLR